MIMKSLNERKLVRYPMKWIIDSYHLQLDCQQQINSTHGNYLLLEKVN